MRLGLEIATSHIWAGDNPEPLLLLQGAVVGHKRGELLTRDHWVEASGDSKVPLSSQHRLAVSL